MSLKKSIIYTLLFGFIMTIPQIGCERRPIKIDGRTRKMIDTIAIREIKIMRGELDSICEENFDAHVERFVDSIKQVRLDEIIQLHK